MTLLGKLYLCRRMNSVICLNIAFAFIAAAIVVPTVVQVIVVIVLSRTFAPG